MMFYIPWIFILHFFICASCATDYSGHYLTQDGIIVENTLQGSEQDLRLEDFFWTGSGDGPPAYLRKPIVPLSEASYGRDTIVKTATILATVYIDGDVESGNDPLCVFDCINENENENPSEKYLPSDRRYWLLTVIAGFFGPQDFPLIEEKLAKLYRIAFTRQQARHLGLSNNTVVESPLVNKSKRSSDTNNNNYSSTGEINMTISATKTIKSPPNRRFLNRRNILLNLNVLRHESNAKKIKKRSTFSESINASLSANNEKNYQQMKYQKFSSVTSDSGQNKSTKAKVQKVSVLIHNMTQLTEDDLKNAENQIDFITDSNFRNNTPFSNQTEIIYTVFVGRRPVLATTAAEDMKLVSQEEVAHVMENMVYTKAEPYLKEPLATPLVPAIINGNSNLVALIKQNPIMFAAVCTLFLLLIILLIGLLLMTRAKKKHSAEVQRLTTQALISQGHQQNTNRSGERNKDDISGNVASGDGVDNLGYNQDLTDVIDKRKINNQNINTPPSLHFPLPPLSRPSSTTSSSTSDSSIYFAKKRSRLDLQNILDEKAASLFHKKHPKQFNGKDMTLKGEAIYTTITKIRDKKKEKHKLRRKYMSENRVGSIDADGQHASPSSGGSETTIAVKSSSHLYEHNEAFNPHVVSMQYHKNKILGATLLSTAEQQLHHHGKLSEEFEVASSVLDSPNEAINKEILKVLQKGDRSSGDSGSIGSFLSMGSVKSFPKCTVPEPLSRVLEPVSVTHFDHYDIDIDSIKSIEKLESHNRGNHLKNIDRKFEVGHQYNDVHLIRSQSDGTDPGVIGPIVWEIHKKEMENKDVPSPLRDPAATRNRFESLLEGAIKMYEGTNSKSEDRQFGHDMPGLIRNELRGKSAIVSRNDGLSRSCSGIIRPVTAGALTTTNESSTLPPTPTRRAWGSGAPSPLVRPLSAGPFHRPEAPTVDITRVLAPQNPINSVKISTAPLIEAIQNELKKFSHEKK